MFCLGWCLVFVFIVVIDLGDDFWDVKIKFVGFIRGLNKGEERV